MKKLYIIFVFLGLMSFIKLLIPIDKQDSTLYLKAFGTEYNCEYASVFILITMISFFIYFAYLVIDKLKFEINPLGRFFHVVLSSLSLLGILIPKLFIIPLLSNDESSIADFLIFVSMLFVFFQLIFLINIGVGVFNVTHNKSS
jgi:hypothetical protein